MPYWDIKYIGRETHNERDMRDQNKAWAKLSDALPGIKRRAKQYGARKFVVYEVVGGFRYDGFIRDKLKVVGVWELNQNGKYIKQIKKKEWTPFGL